MKMSAREFTKLSLRTLRHPVSPGRIQRMTAALMLILLLFTGSVFAQESVVAQVKADLQARGIDLSGPCGAFQITKRVAWQLRGLGVGLLAKRADQNNCELKGVDVVAYQDGRIIDILGASGDPGGNRPQWNLALGSAVGLWVAPTDPGDTAPSTGGQPPPPSSPPAPISVQTLDLSPILARLQQTDDHVERTYLDLSNRITALSQQQAANTNQILEAVNEPAFISKFLGNRYVQLALAAVSTYYTTKAMGK